MIDSPDTFPVHHAELAWDEEGQPLSSVFGDVYFSRANGLEETRHVFLQHNQLNERWQQLQPGQHFTIAETGFGSGLNFLAAWQLWLETAPVNAQLHFVSVEKFPLSQPDLQRALALWPALAQLADQLIANYPVFVGQGFHRLGFMSGRIQLTLIIDDAALGFRHLLATRHPAFAHHCAKVDAWFLDGFAPAKNPHMWSDELFDVIGALSKAGTTAATFSAASLVKNGLKRAGFGIQKVAGFGRKREMTKAVMEQTPAPAPFDHTRYRSYSPYPVPWAIHADYSLPHEKHALIIGAGLAGCTSAHALAARGWKVTLVERHSDIAQEASGNPQGVLYAKLSHKNEAQAEFNLACLQFALHFYRDYWDSCGSKCGVLQLAHSEAEHLLHMQLQERFSAADELVKFVDAANASEIAGIALNHSALFFPQAGWINPRALCARLSKHPNITLVTGCEAQGLDYDGQYWGINHHPNIRAPIAIIANARDAKHFTQTANLPIKSIRGQITYLPQTPLSSGLKTLVCGEGYIGPAVNGFHCTGATFNLRDATHELREEDHRTNLASLRESLADAVSAWEALGFTTLDGLARLDGRVAFRCALPDYLPLVGSVANEPLMKQDFAPLRKNSRAAIHLTGHYLPGLYINIGHGSRGLAYTPLCAELLAATINQEILPIPRELANALNPARFLIRDLIKNKH